MPCFDFPPTSLGEELPRSGESFAACGESDKRSVERRGGKVAAAYEQFGKEVADIGEKQRKQNRADRIR